MMGIVLGKVIPRSDMFSFVINLTRMNSAKEGWPCFYIQYRLSGILSTCSPSQSLRRENIKQSWSPKIEKEATNEIDGSDHRQ